MWWEYNGICVHIYIIKKYTYTHTCMHAYRQTDRPTDRQTYRHTDRRTYIHVYMYICIYVSMWWVFSTPFFRTIWWIRRVVKKVWQRWLKALRFCSDLGLTSSQNFKHKEMWLRCTSLTQKRAPALSRHNGFRPGPLARCSSHLISLGLCRTQRLRGQSGRSCGYDYFTSATRKPWLFIATRPGHTLAPAIDWLLSEPVRPLDMCTAGIPGIVTVCGVSGWLVRKKGLSWDGGSSGRCRVRVSAKSFGDVSHIWDIWDIWDIIYDHMIFCQTVGYSCIVSIIG